MSDICYLFYLLQFIQSSAIHPIFCDFFYLLSSIHDDIPAVRHQPLHQPLITHGIIDSFDPAPAAGYQLLIIGKPLLDCR